MKKFSSLIYFLAFLSFIGCKQEKPEIEKANRIVFIFNNPVRHGFNVDPKTGVTSFGRTKDGRELQYYDENFFEKKIEIHFDQPVDTISIPTTREYVEFRLMYKGVDDLYYYFQNGDTVVFNYIDSKPIASILNRKSNERALNFDLFVRDSIARDDFKAADLLNLPLFLLKVPNKDEKDFTAFFKRIEAKNLANLNQEYIAEILELESLKNKGIMSSLEFTERLRSLYMTMKKSTVWNNSELEKSRVREVVKVLKDIELKYPEITKKRSDSLLLNHNYRAAYMAETTQKALEGLTQYEKTSSQAGMRMPDYLGAYDRIKADTLKSWPQRKILLYDYVSKMLEQGRGLVSIENQLKYVTKLKNDLQDSTMVAKLEKKYDIKFEIDNEIKLESINGEKTTLKALIASHQETMLYLDFWASWCAPCLGEMPYSKELSHQTTHMNLKYIFISTDYKSEAWKKAIQNESIEGFEHYRITNTNTSKGFENLNVPFIPRYMIFDPDGILVNDDAPRPSENEMLMTEFSKYLEED